MPANQNVYDSYGPEVTASENMGPPPPQVNHAQDPLYAMDHNRDGMGSQTDPAHSTANIEKTTDRRLGPMISISDLPRGTFWIVVGVIILLVCIGIGVGVGVGVGVTQTNSGSASDSPSSTSTSPTTTAPVTSGTVGVASNSCDSDDRDPIDRDGTRFIPYCFTDWPQGIDAAEGDETVRDVGSAMTYTFEECMDECVSHNDDLREDEARCEAISYLANLTFALGEKNLDANCYLKDRQGENDPGGENIASAHIER